MSKRERKVSRKRLEKGGWRQIKPLVHNLLLFKKDSKFMVWDSNTHEIEAVCKMVKDEIENEKDYVVL